MLLGTRLNDSVIDLTAILTGGITVLLHMSIADKITPCIRFLSVVKALSPAFLNFL